MSTHVDWVGQGGEKEAVEWLKEQASPNLHDPNLRWCLHWRGCLLGQDIIGHWGIVQVGGWKKWHDAPCLQWPTLKNLHGVEEQSRGLLGVTMPEVLVILKDKGK